MIAFACATTDEREFRAYAAPATARVAEESSLLLRRHRVTERARAYNEMIAIAAEREDLEALVLIDQGVTIESDGFLADLRALLSAGEDIAVIGAGDSPAKEVATVGGELVVLTARFCSTLRFDPRLSVSPDAAVADLCMAARTAGGRIVAAPLGVVPKPRFELRSARRARAGAALRRKWHLEPNAEGAGLGPAPSEKLGLKSR